MALVFLIYEGSKRGIERLILRPRRFNQLDTIVRIEITSFVMSGIFSSSPSILQPTSIFSTVLFLSILFL